MVRIRSPRSGIVPRDYFRSIVKPLDKVYPCNNKDNSLYNLINQLLLKIPNYDKGSLKEKRSKKIFEIIDEPIESSAISMKYVIPRSKKKLPSIEILLSNIVERESLENLIRITPNLNINIMKNDERKDLIDFSDFEGKTLGIYIPGEYKGELEYSKEKLILSFTSDYFYHNRYGCLNQEELDHMIHMCGNINEFNKRFGQSWKPLFNIQDGMQSLLNTIDNEIKNKGCLPSRESIYQKSKIPSEKYETIHLQKVDKSASINTLMKMLKKSVEKPKEWKDCFLKKENIYSTLPNKFLSSASEVRYLIFSDRDPHYEIDLIGKISKEDIKKFCAELDITLFESKDKEGIDRYLLLEKKRTKTRILGGYIPGNHEDEERIDNVDDKMIILTTENSAYFNPKQGYLYPEDFKKINEAFDGDLELEYGEWKPIRGISQKLSTLIDRIDQILRRNDARTLNQQYLTDVPTGHRSVRFRKN